ncbi:YtxH-like protein [Dyadobacter jejuensis]|uniref:YtxH-like protein n=1 Tax=Dyadobacter jejuensis TaxID=1082580 RepID=A0A316AR65_9BACT|nr:YtxH domain-containing protein [Dyadobacter jejuensis]PWJ59876.1 YtxH-like protein [Dyadobacter jejuensis]
MSVNKKHLATFILGAAAGVAAHKYLQTEEGEKLLEDLKSKASNLKSEAEQAVDKGPEYFEELKTKGTDLLKTNFPDVEQFLKELFEKFKGNPSATDAAPTEPPTPTT